MCGISGIVFRKGISVYEAERIGSLLLRAQQHRGPDGSGMIVADENWNVFPLRTDHSPQIIHTEIPYLDFKNKTDIHTGIKMILCHNRLSVIDLSPYGHQPMTNKEQTLWITYNGEIYNYPELREKYFIKDFFYSQSDTEILLKTIEKKGIERIEELNGMWAFACLDLKDKKLTLCRDRLGVKPLYYFHSPDYFIFSSEVKTLLASGIVVSEIDFTRLPFYLYKGQSDFHDKTFFKNIYPVPAGSWLNFNITKHQIDKIENYFQINFREEEIKYPEKKILQTLRESVQRHLRSDIPVGLSLSGGIDSSAILTLASEIQGNKIPCFSAFMTGFEKDESDTIKKITSQFKSELYSVIPNGEDFFNRLDELQKALDFPLFDGSTFAQFLVMEKAAKSGIRVILGGQGSDEWNAGYLHHVYIHHFHNSFKGWMFFCGDIAKHPGKFFSEYMHVFYPKWVFHSKKSHRFPFIQEDVFRNDDFLQSLIPDKDLNDSLLKDLTDRRLPGFLRCEDRTSMWFGVESRPLFSDDREWINLAQAIKPELKVRKKTGKYILRKALKELLPEYILENKNKIAFSVPAFDWFRINEKEVLNFIFENSDLIHKNKFPQRITHENFVYVSRLFFYEHWRKKLKL
jgi:asparagine synthase (glutamine-hydrolysing)